MFLSIEYLKIDYLNIWIFEYFNIWESSIWELSIWVLSINVIWLVRVRVGSRVRSRFQMFCIQTPLLHFDSLLKISLWYSVFFGFKSLSDTPRDLMWACRLAPRFNVKLMLRNIFDAGQETAVELLSVASHCVLNCNSNVQWGQRGKGCGICNAGDAERKIFGVRKLGFKHLYSFLRSSGRWGSLLVVRVKARIVQCSWI